MLSLFLFLLTVLILGLLARDLREGRALPIVESGDAVATEPISVLVPARDEAARIGRLLDALSRQRGAEFEVIVLDDHSTDGTATVVEQYMGRLPALRIVAGAALPAGWAGKCWACWQLARHSRYRWLLFLDADTAPAPDALAALQRRAHTRRLDFLSVLPFLELGSFAERLLLPPFTLLIQAVFPFSKVNDRRSPLAMANGQCILITRDAYWGSGGHQAVRMSILEDVRLAQTVKQRGYAIELVAGPEILRVRMYTRFSEIAEGLRKNAWAGYSAGGWRSAWGGLRQALIAGGPAALLIAGLVAWRAAAPAAASLLGAGLLLSVATTCYWAYVARRLFRLNPLWGLLIPFGTLGYFMLAGLAWISIRRGAGVAWKGRAYRGS